MKEQDDFTEAVLTSNASVFVVMLGSNDAKSGMWSPYDFFNDYLELCKVLKSQPQEPKVFLVAPPPFYPQFGNKDKIMPEVVNEYVPFLTKDVAQKCGLPDDHFIDVFEGMGGANLTLPELFCDPKVIQYDQRCDGFHPNKVGYSVIAQVMFDTLYQGKRW